MVRVFIRLMIRQTRAKPSFLISPWRTWTEIVAEPFLHRNKVPDRPKLADCCRKPGKVAIPFGTVAKTGLTVPAEEQTRKARWRCLHIALELMSLISA